MIPTAPPPPVQLVGYRDYLDAQAAVDTLSDAGFPVGQVSIVWSGLRRIERVTGRRTVATAALEGALSGAWFGSLIGLLTLLFISADDTPVIGLMATYLLVGAVAGSLWSAIGHARKGGRRDFATISEFDAEEYQLWVGPDLAGQAGNILGLATHRSEDAGPSPTIAPTDPTVEAPPNRDELV